MLGIDRGAIIELGWLIMEVDPVGDKFIGLGLCENFCLVFAPFGTFDWNMDDWLIICGLIGGEYCS